MQIDVDCLRHKSAVIVQLTNKMGHFRIL